MTIFSTCRVFCQAPSHLPSHTKCCREENCGHLTNIRRDPQGTQHRSALDEVPTVFQLVIAIHSPFVTTGWVCLWCQCLFQMHVRIYIYILYIIIFIVVVAVAVAVVVVVVVVVFLLSLVLISISMIIVIIINIIAIYIYIIVMMIINSFHYQYLLSCFTC